MTTLAESRDPLEAQIARAHDEAVLEEWAPARYGIAPRIRIGKRWFNALWLLPIGFVGLVLAAAVAHELRWLPAVQEFIARYPGEGTGGEYEGFPGWLRLNHVFNLFMMLFIIRSGIQILADHPRLYWNRDCTPGTEWFRFQHAVPKGATLREGTRSFVLWTAKDDAVTIPSWLGIPGIRHSIGLARWWHFSCDLLWLINGIVFYVFLFTTYQWQRLVPRSWDVFPNALSMALQYLALTPPPTEAWVRYNALQQLAYFTTVFIAAPGAAFFGLMQAPAIANRFLIGKLVNRQVARSIHFFIMLYFVGFIGVHVSLVFITGMRKNLNHITLGTDTSGWGGTIIAFIAIAILATIWIRVSPFTLKHARLVQGTGKFLVGWAKGLMEYWDPDTKRYTEKDISPYLWPNGLLPTSGEYKELADGGYQAYKLRVDGLVEKPQEFSLAQLKAMPKQEQITAHYCIQGWSGVAKWAGVPMRHIMELVKPTAAARYAVFYSFGEGGDGGMYYDAHKMQNMKHELTVLAYEMNGQQLSTVHGAPLRLRCENQLGFKQVKWIRAIEFVDDFSRIGSGEGGYNEDHEFYGYRMPI